MLDDTATVIDGEMSLLVLFVVDKSSECEGKMNDEVGTTVLANSIDVFIKDCDATVVYSEAVLLFTSNLLLVTDIVV